jgi:hypothetical protein
MDELDEVKETFTGQPIPHNSAGEQACQLCSEINFLITGFDAPPMRQHVFEEGDEVIFRASRRTPEHRHGPDEVYQMSPHVYHASHDGEHGDSFEVGGSLAEHNVVCRAVVEQTGVDYGKQLTEVADIDYEPDFDENAVTLGQVEVLAYESPHRGEENESFAEMPEPVVPVEGMNGTWAEELQRSIYDHIQRHG